MIIFQILSQLESRHFTNISVSKISADVFIQDAADEEWDLIAVPGGLPGAEHLRDSKPLIQLLEKQNKAGKLYGAICASPALVLATHGLITEGATCYPAAAFRDSLKNPVDDDVVVKDNLTTSKGPGTSLKFALMLGEHMYGKDKANEIASAMLVER
jgi:protein deglycase